MGSKYITGMPSLNKNGDKVDRLGLIFGGFEAFYPGLYKMAIKTRQTCDSLFFIGLVCAE